MKQTFLILGVSTLLCLALIACNDDEESVVPDMSPSAQKNVAAEATSEPELQPIQALVPSSNSKANTNLGNNAPGEEGSYTIQVGIQPSKKGADALIEKLEASGIEGAYVAQVENPGELEGTYYRIRIGFFKTIPQAQAYGKNALETLGYAWWVDNRANDTVGEPTSLSSHYTNDAEPTALEPTPESTPVQSAEEPSSAESSATSSSASAVVPVESTTVVTPAPANTAPAPIVTAPAEVTPPVTPAPADTSDAGYDDWE